MLDLIFLPFLQHFDGFGEGSPFLHEGPRLLHDPTCIEGVPHTSKRRLGSPKVGPDDLPPNEKVGRTVVLPDRFQISGFLRTE